MRVPWDKGLESEEILQRSWRTQKKRGGEWNMENPSKTVCTSNSKANVLDKTKWKRVKDEDEGWWRLGLCGFIGYKYKVTTHKTKLVDKTKTRKMGASHPHAFLFLFFQASSKASLPFFTATKTKTLFALNLQCHTPKQICKCYLASILPLQLNGNHFSSSSLTTACSCTILVQIPSFSLPLND